MCFSLHSWCKWIDSTQFNLYSAFTIRIKCNMITYSISTSGLPHVYFCVFVFCTPQCTVTCGPGLRYRVVLCVDHSGQHAGGCSPHLKPHIKEDCLVPVACHKPRGRNNKNLINKTYIGCCLELCC